MIVQEVVASGHNKSYAASGYSRFLAGPLGQLDILYWLSVTGNGEGMGWQDGGLNGGTH